MLFCSSHVYPMQVQFEDVDAGGVVHHPRYLLFTERARYAALLEIDFGFERQLREGQTFAVAEVASRYVRPLSMGQRIWVVTRTVACRKSSLKTYHAIVTREPSAADIQRVGDNIFELPEIAFCAQMRFVYVDLSAKKSIEIPLASREKLAIPLEAFFDENPCRRDVRLGEWPS
jgi:YbgC/YbaW family acyl-CoA thioester hydrolase